MWWPFRKKKKIDPFSIRHEKWVPNLLKGKDVRFLEEKTDSYESGLKSKAFQLVIKKANHFAWVLDPVFRYDNFVLEADLSFGEQNGYSAVGFLFRYLNDENFYYFLVSNHGSFRFDVVFNGNPQVLIDWTTCPALKAKDNTLRIIIKGTRFSFYVDDQWVGEMEDDTISNGNLAFAAQNFEEKAIASFSLKRWELESRPVEVEALSYRWQEYLLPDPRYRVNLARSFFRIGYFLPAIVQFKKAFKLKKPTPEEFFLLGESFLNLGVYDSALTVLEKCLELDPAHQAAMADKANILYLLNRFLELRDYLKSNLEKWSENPALFNLYGNAEYALGNWTAALEKYEKAAQLQPDMPLFVLNAAKTMEQQNCREKALNYYIQASRLFFRQEAYDEIKGLLPSIERLDPANGEIKAIQAKILFHEEQYEQSKGLLKKLVEEQHSLDSGLLFLYALILNREKDMSSALSYIKQAAELEPDFYLYWYKMAEIKHLQGVKLNGALDKALALNSEDPWVLNLAGQIRMDEGDYSDAAGYLKKALRNAPDEIDILINYSEVLFRSGDREAAFGILKERQDAPKVLNQKGNMFSWEGKLEEALEEYEKALKQEPENAVFMENCAACSVQLDYISRAEELLVKLMDIEPTPKVYRLMGEVARIMGQFSRAEAVYGEGVKYFPTDLELKLALGDLYFTLSKYQQAREILSPLMADSNQLNREERERVRVLFEKIRERTEEKLECASCGREWWVSRNLAFQPPLKLYAIPPGDTPAGKCGICGKIYCIECASKSTRENRFVCAECDEFLKLSENSLRFLVSRAMDKIQDRTQE